MVPSSWTTVRFSPTGAGAFWPALALYGPEETVSAVRRARAVVIMAAMNVRRLETIWQPWHQTPHPNVIQTEATQHGHFPRHRSHGLHRFTGRQAARCQGGEGPRPRPRCEER